MDQKAVVFTTNGDAELELTHLKMEDSDPFSLGLIWYYFVTKSFAQHIFHSYLF